MSLTNVISLLGGLALFLYGMQMMSQGLEAAAGNRMKQILEKLTANRIMGVVLGAVITAVIQSSSATTVMVVGFVNSGLMTLSQAVWIIMGANIGTTITGQLIALDAGAVAPMIAFIGVVLIVFLKNEKSHYIGGILAGLGILFIGMDMMSASMSPLAESDSFINILTRFENPILGILAGMVFTALIQSSSASVGILQALAASGIVSLNSAAYILFGQNIGTCITALLASVGTNRNAKRATVIHIMFNVIGTILFTTLCLVTPLIFWMQEITPGSVPGQIANMHTLFNVVTTIVLLPFGNRMTELAKIIMPDGHDKNNVNNHLVTVNKEGLGQSAIGIEETKKELEHMLGMARENVHCAFDVFISRDKDALAVIEKREDDVDCLNKEISRYITTAIPHESTETGSKMFSAYLTITGNIERISDHAMNIAGYSKMCNEMDASFSDTAKKEVKYIQDICDRLFGYLFNIGSDAIEWHTKVACMEQLIDDITREYRDNMFRRIQNEACSYQGSILYSEMLTDFERIGDHALNIADEIVNIKLIEK